MEDGIDYPLLYLRDLPAATSEKALSGVLEALWKTRKTGLGDAEESRIQSLLGLSQPATLGPILACIRLIIRNFVHGKLSIIKIKELLKPHVSVELQSIFVLLLQKYQGQWMEVASPSREQLCQNHKKVPYQYQVKGTPEPAIASFPASELSPYLWSRQVCAFTNSHRILPQDVNNEGQNPASVASERLHQDTSFRETKVPRLKSMTWTMQNKNLRPANRVAIITLKLQDHTMSTGEIEVKFEVSKDILEAMLRSMTHIKEKLSNTVEPPEQVAKKQKQ